MAAKIRQDKAMLLATAKAIAEQMKSHCEGTSLRIRIPSRATTTRNTDGWRASIGNLGKNQPHLEIWLDRITGYPDRKLYACFYAQARQQITIITKRVSRDLWPVRVVNHTDTSEEKYLVFNERLKLSEFNAPILEKYYKGNTFYGIYDLTRGTSKTNNPHFCNSAVAFFVDVVRTLPKVKAGDESQDIYVNETKKRRFMHLMRDRSQLLATQTKIRDKYKCQVCSMRFENIYGKHFGGKRLGQGFAEAHHTIQLSKLKANAKTCIEDMQTVCSNCHRMLHRMTGKCDDVKKLRDIVKKHRCSRTVKQEL